MFFKNLILSAIVALAFASASGLAAEAAKPMTAQQMKMSQCNKDATGKSGDARKVFMKTCLSATSAPKPTQQTKMKTCNADASTKALKGDERKAYMKTCLSAGSTPAMQ